MALAAGAFVMQFGVQGVFGVIPAHLNELSPPTVRSLFPGVVYQLGMLFGAPSVGIEFALRRRLGYSAGRWPRLKPRPLRRCFCFARWGRSGREERCEKQGIGSGE